jgi:uncharacterized membrane protein
MQLIVLVTSLKYFFVEGGEQFIVGLQTSKRIGLRPTIKITLVGISFAVILFLIFFYSRTLIPTKVLEFMLGVALYYFSFRMFKEAVKEKDTMDGNHLHEESLHKGYRYGYIYLVSLESIENSSALAALTFVDITGALAGALISITLFVVLAIKAKSIMDKMPVKKLRIISGVLLGITATPLIIYSTGLPSPEWMHWIIPPLGE